MPLSTLALLACAVLLALCGASLAAWRLARMEAARLRADTEAARAASAEARTLHEVARATADAHARAVAERDAALAALRRDADAHLAAHRDAESRCAEARSTCAQATEAVQRLEHLAEQLRADHAAATVTLRADHDAIQATLREEGARVAERLRSVEDEFNRLSAAHARLQSERDERLAAAEREVARLLTLREDMTKEFQALAAATLRDTGAQFSASHHAKLTELLTPFREQVGRFETELRQVHQEADKDRAVLSEQIKALSAQAQAVSADAANLARALRGDKQRQGAWGEAQLERYLELMGYKRDVDYEVQASRTGEDGGRKRPDVILHLPDGKSLVIDAKVSLSAYADFVAADTDEERERCLRLHARNVRDRVDELASRDYPGVVEGSVDWVLLFMPIEGAVAAAWDDTGEVAAYAMERGVGLAYPTTLLMALKTVRHIWNVEKRNKNAEEIAGRAGRLYDKLATFIDSFTRVGAAIEDARRAHDKALGQLSRGQGNLVGQVQKLKDLGARANRAALGLGHDGDDDEPRILGLPDPEPEPPMARPAG